MLKYDLAIDYIIEMCGDKYFEKLEAPRSETARNKFYVNHALSLLKNKTRSFLANKLINRMILTSGGFGTITSAAAKWGRRLES